MSSIELLINLICSFYLMVGSSLSLFERKKGRPLTPFAIVISQSSKIRRTETINWFKKQLFFPSFLQNSCDRMNSARSQAETKKAARAEPGKTHKTLRPQGPSQLDRLRTAFSPEIDGIGRAMMLSLSLCDVRIWWRSWIFIDSRPFRPLTVDY